MGEICCMRFLLSSSTHFSSISINASLMQVLRFTLLTRVTVTSNYILWCVGRWFWTMNLFICVTSLCIRSILPIFLLRANLCKIDYRLLLILPWLPLLIFPPVSFTWWFRRLPYLFDIHCLPATTMYFVHLFYLRRGSRCRIVILPLQLVWGEALNFHVAWPAVTLLSQHT